MLFKFKMLHCEQKPLLNIYHFCFYYSSRPILTKTNQIKSQSELSERIRKKNQTPNSDLAKPPSKSGENRSKFGSKRVPSNVTKVNNNLMTKSTSLLKMDGPKKWEAGQEAPLEPELAQQALRREKAYLNQVSFKIRYQLLDEKGQELLKKHSDSLARTSTDPKHLTVLHDEFASKIASLLYDKIYKSSEDKMNVKNRTFVELQPGFGLITRKLIEAITKSPDNCPSQNQHSSKFVLIESFGQFFPYLNELKQFADRNNIELDILKQKAFSQFEANFSNSRQLGQCLNRQASTIGYILLLVLCKMFLD